MFGYIVAAGTWTTGKAALNISLMAGLGTLFWFLTEDATSEQTDTHTAWTYMLYALGLSIVLVLAESAKLAQLCGALVSGIGIWWVSSWFGARIGKPLSLAWGRSSVYRPQCRAGSDRKVRSQLAYSERLFVGRPDGPFGPPDALPPA